MAPEPGSQTIVYTRSEGNQTMKFGQIIGTWETFFLRNYRQNMVQKLVPDPVLKN